MAAMVVLLPPHFSLSVIVQTGQRFELFLFPLVVGAFAALSGRITPMLQAYVVSATVLAVAWPLDLLGGQKNPVGGLIGNAIILLVGVPALRRLYPCLIVLAPGLLLTQSRGAIIATVVGVVVMMAMQGLSARPFAARIAPLVLIAAVAFVLLPSATQDRITTLSASTTSSAGLRDRVPRASTRPTRGRSSTRIPWTGIGVGNYLAGDPYDLTQSTDPHQVLLLQAAEGGYGLAAAFVLFVAGSVLALYRMRRIELAPVAAGVLVATAAHGLVDVYWVRVTPVLGWLLVGMVCGLYAESRRTDAAA